MAEYPLVSVIIPTYSRPINLCRAIDSVLNQTYQPIEIIVVDDNGVGTEFQVQTESVLRKYIDMGQIVYVKHDVNKNGSAARNTGFRISKGEYINFLDDDDVLIPVKVEHQVSTLLCSDDKVGACYCNTLIKWGDSRPDEYITNYKNGNIVEDMLMGKHFFNTSTILFKRNVICEINGWDESFFRHQDWELMIRFFRNHNILLSSENQYPVIKYHTHNAFVNPEKAIEFREYFLSKMSEDIDKMQNSNEIYFKQYDMLVYNFFKLGYRKHALRCLKKAYSFKKPSVSNLFHQFCRFLLSFPRGWKIL